MVGAEDRLRVEARPSTVSGFKKVRSFAVNAVLAAFSGPVSWPPVDIVLIDEVSGETVRTWHEGGDAASLLTAVLNEDLAEMTLDDFAEKWDLSIQE